MADKKPIGRPPKSGFPFEEEETGQPEPARIRKAITRDQATQMIEELFLDGVPATAVVAKVARACPDLPEAEIQIRLDGLAQVYKDRVSRDGLAFVSLEMLKIYKRSQRRSAKIRTATKKAAKAQSIRTPDWVKMGQAEDKIQLEILNKIGYLVDRSTQPSPGRPRLPAPVEVPEAEDASEPDGEEVGQRINDEAARRVLSPVLGVVEEIRNKSAREAFIDDSVLQNRLSKATMDGSRGLPSLTRQVLDEED